MSFPNLNSLRVFTTVARHLTLRRAAEELGVTQGAVSQQIKQLEAQLKVPLFTRHARGLHLTEAGQDLYIPVKQAISTISQAIEKLSSENSAATVAISPSLAAKWLAPRLPQLADTHPEIDLSLLPTRRPDRHSSADLILHLGPEPRATGRTVRRLAPLRPVMVASPTLVPRAPVILRPDWVLGFSLIEDALTPWQSYLDRHAPDLQAEPHRYAQSALALNAAEAGNGIALVPDLLANEAITQKRLIWLHEEAPDDAGGLYLIHKGDTVPNAACQRVIDWIETQL